MQLLATHHAPRTTPTDRLDPRTRIVAAVAFSVVVAVANGFPTLAAALGLAVLTTALGRLRPTVVLRRLVPLNLFMLLLVVLLPLTIDRSAPGTFPSLGYRTEGLELPARIALKGNAIVLILTALLATLDVTRMGHALAHLRMPQKLVHLLMMTVRYLDVLKRETLRLLAAMKLRGFRPRMNLHTYRTLGYLVGMLLVRSLDRSERIMRAMKCRGFRGRFYLLDHFAFSARDVWFAGVWILMLVALSVLEWT